VDLMARLPDTPEIRGYAFETRFLVDPALGERIREWTRARLSADPHGGGPAGDEYGISSLYFETPDYDVFRRQRSYRRSKYRIRRYIGGDAVFLERKLRTSARLEKRRTLVTPDDLRRFGAAGPAPQWSGSWFHRRIAVRRLRPVCQLTYRRIARVGASEHGPFRVTLDHQLSVLPVSQAAFADCAGTALLRHGFILELKYRATPPPVMNELVQEFGLRPKRLSKYRLGVLALVDRIAGGLSDLREANTIELRYA
jgi:hypothetical protein